MKPTNIFLTTVFLIIFSLGKAQENKSQIWGELIYENTFGANVNVKNHQLVYRLEYMHFASNGIFGEIEHQYNRLDAGIEYVIPYESENTAITTGAGLGYLFGKHYERLSTGNFGNPDYDITDYSSIAGTFDAKFNFYLSNHVGVGIGAKETIGKNYSQFTPQLRLLLGNLK